LKTIQKHRVLVGFDFAFGNPFADCGSYFPGLIKQPKTVEELWALVEKVCHGTPDFYGAPFYRRKDLEFYRYYLSPYGKGDRYRFRQRITEVACSNVTAPHPVLKCIGPANVGTGSLAGMRFLKGLLEKAEKFVSIWPFGAMTEKSVVVEIFPRLYFKKAGADPRDWVSIGSIDKVLNYYGSQSLDTNWKPEREDEADALVSAAALRGLTMGNAVWSTPKSNRSIKETEGWIFGVDWGNY
tara:strand:- start:203 stop:922 length:720 start_codon:yes stop_codon:yes gene_type:complete